MHILMFRVQYPAAEAESFDLRYHSQHQRGEAAQPGRRHQYWRLGLEEAAPLLHGNRQKLPHTHGGRTVQLYLWVPGGTKANISMSTTNKLHVNWKWSHLFFTPCRDFLSTRNGNSFFDLLGALFMHISQTQNNLAAENRFFPTAVVSKHMLYSIILFTCILFSFSSKMPLCLPFSSCWRVFIPLVPFC